MELEATKRSRIAVLHQEIDATDFANNLYRGRKDHSQEASAAYQCRQQRLEKIRRELAELEIRV